MRHAFKRENVDKGLRDALMALKVSTGVHENYSAMVRSVLSKHQSDINLPTLRGWLKAWCEKGKPIPQYYSPHEVLKSRKADFPRSPRPEPVFTIFQDEVTDQPKEDKPEEQPTPSYKPPITLSIGKTSEIMIDNGFQSLMIKSVDGYLTILQA